MNESTANCPDPLAALGHGRFAGRAPAGGRRPPVWTIAEFLELLLQDELLVRGQRQIERRIKPRTSANSRRSTSSTSPSTPRSSGRQIFDLAAGRLPPRSARRAADRTSGNRQEPHRPGPGLPGHQGRIGRCSTARSSTWSATSSTTRRSISRRRSWSGTSAPTC